MALNGEGVTIKDRDWPVHRSCDVFSQGLLIQNNRILANDSLIFSVSTWQNDSFKFKKCIFIRNNIFLKTILPDSAKQLQQNSKQWMINFSMIPKLSLSQTWTHTWREAFNRTVQLGWLQMKNLRWETFRLQKVNDLHQTFFIIHFNRSNKTFPNSQLVQLNGWNEWRNDPQGPRLKFDVGVFGLIKKGKRGLSI